MSSRIFDNIPQNGPEYSHRNLAIARFLVTAVRKNVGGLHAVLVGLIVKLSPGANSRWVEKGPPCQSLGEGAGKAWCLSLVLLRESQCTGHVCL